MHERLLWSVRLHLPKQHFKSELFLSIGLPSISHLHENLLLSWHYWHFRKVGHHGHHVLRHHLALWDNKLHLRLAELLTWLLTGKLQHRHLHHSVCLACSLTVHVDKLLQVACKGLVLLHHLLALRERLGLELLLVHLIA